jgi:Rrf2 family protein
MKLSSRARYALRAMMVIAREGSPAKPANLRLVAARTAISRRYLEQVVISLKSAGLLKAVSGNKGGHYLARPANTITLGQIVEAAIGPLNIVECVGNAESCMRAKGCGPIWPITRWRRPWPSRLRCRELTKRLTWKKEEGRIEESADGDTGVTDRNGLRTG